MEGEDIRGFSSNYFLVLLILAMVLRTSVSK